MAIRNDLELAEAVDEVDRLLQDIQNYAQRDFNRPARIRFPRGYIRTATEQRARLPFLRDSNLKSNIAYVMLLSDVLHWLLVRTDLGGTAKEMLIKLQLFLLGSIVESITKVTLRGRCGGNYCRRTEYLENHGVITAQLRADLDWLWEMRNRMHLFQLTDSEWNIADYTVAALNRGVRAFQGLLAALR